MARRFEGFSIKQFFLKFQNFIFKMSKPTAFSWCRFYMGLNGKTEGVPKDVEVTLNSLLLGEATFEGLFR